VLLNQHMKIAKSENRVNKSTLGILFEKFYTKTLNTLGTSWVVFIGSMGSIRV
jgi:hypothetical protein